MMAGRRLVAVAAKSVLYFLARADTVLSAAKTTYTAEQSGLNRYVCISTASNVRAIWRAAARLALLRRVRGA